MTVKRPKPALTHAPDHPKLDGRTRQAKRIQAIKQGLIDNPKAAGRAILRDIVSRNTTIEQEIFTLALNQGLLTDSGKLNPLIQKDLLKYQSAGKTALIEYLKLSGKDTPDGNDFADIFDSVFDDTEN